MKDSAIYLKAAELLWQRDVVPSCVAIQYASKFSGMPTHKYQQLMQPNEYYESCWRGMVYCPSASSRKKRESRNHRLIMLLLMSAITADEERAK